MHGVLTVTEWGCAAKNGGVWVDVGDVGGGGEEEKSIISYRLILSATFASHESIVATSVNHSSRRQKLDHTTLNFTLPRII